MFHASNPVRPLHTSSHPFRFTWSLEFGRSIEAGDAVHAILPRLLCHYDRRSHRRLIFAAATAAAVATAATMATAATAPRSPSRHCLECHLRCCCTTTTMASPPPRHCHRHDTASSATSLPLHDHFQHTAATTANAIPPP
uniref:Uncharacterized protein n=1 Tax=Chlamydomonas euryale TaxID=1486919 RepID=A0A6U2C422_9CHLO